MHAVDDQKRRLALALLGAAMSFAVLSTIFGYTMWLHYRAVDWTYAGFAAARILGISVLVGGITYAVGPRRSRAGALGCGALLGVVMGVAYVYAATA